MARIPIFCTAIAISFLLTPLRVLAQTAPAPAPPAVKEAAKQARPMDAFGWLVGGVWTADVSKTMPGMLRIETQYTLSDNGSFLRFTTHFVSSQGTLKNYDGNVYWDPVQKTYRIWYVDFSGAVTEAPIVLNGDHWQMEFSGTDFQDKPADLRVEVDRKSADLYHWKLSEKAGTDWTPLLGLDYLRK